MEPKADKPAKDPFGSRLENVQYLRAIAAIIVVVSHSLNNLSRYGSRTPDLLPGALGVGLFFVISGFIITHTSWKRFGRPSSVGHFVRNRLWRIVPLYWLMTLVFAAVALKAPDVVSHSGVTVTRLICSLLFIPIPSGDWIRSPVFGPGWSLNFEMFFYAVFAVALLAPRRVALIAVSVALVALVLVAPFLPKDSLPAFWGHRDVLEFLAGVWLAAVFNSVKWRAPHMAFWVLFPLLLIALAFASRMTPGVYPTLYTGGVSIAIAAVAVFCRDVSKPNVGSRFLHYVGGASYSLYLTHLLVVRLVMLALPTARHQQPGLPFLIAVEGAILVGAVLMASLSYEVIEQRMAPAIRRLFDRRSGKPSPDKGSSEGNAKATAST